MDSKLTNEMRKALHKSNGRPVDIEDDDGAVYVLVRKDVYLHLENLSGEADEVTLTQLRSMIQEGIDSGSGISADEVFERLRVRAQQLVDSAS